MGAILLMRTDLELTCARLERKKKLVARTLFDAETESVKKHLALLSQLLDGSKHELNCYCSLLREFFDKKLSDRSSFGICALATYPAFDIISWIEPSKTDLEINGFTCKAVSQE